MFRVFHYDILTFTLRRIKAIIGSNHGSLMEPQRSLKITGKNTEYTQNNQKDLHKIPKDRLDFWRSLVRPLKILNEDPQSSFKIMKILEDFWNSLVTFRKDLQRSLKFKDLWQDFWGSFPRSLLGSFLKDPSKIFTRGVLWFSGYGDGLCVVASHSNLPLTTRRNVFSTLCNGPFHSNEFCCLSFT